MITGEISRESHDYTLRSSTLSVLFPPFLGTLLIMLPAFLYGCGDMHGGNDLIPAMQRTGIRTSADITNISTLDVFVFKDDIFQRLDCYQRFDDMEQWEGIVTSGSGGRIITAIANSPYGREDWFPLNSRAYFGKIHFNLEDERREKPFMSGEIAVDAGEGIISAADMPLKPFASEIILNSISCDFSGRPYAGEKLTDTKVYLTNVNAEYGLPDEDKAAPRRIINAGRLHEEDLKDFIQPDILMQEITGDIGKKTVYPDISLLCYASNCTQETPGTPYTRLVIEGKVSGQRYYWPVNINRETEEEAGIWRNRQYIFDLKIKRKGSTDPDMPVKTEDITINQKVAEWKEMPEYEVLF